MVNNAAIAYSCKQSGPRLGVAIGTMDIGYSRGFILAATIGMFYSRGFLLTAAIGCSKWYSQGFVLAATIGCSIAGVFF